MKIKKWITTTVIIAIGVVLAWILLSLPSHKASSKSSVETLRIGLANLNFENKKAGALSKILKEIDPDVIIGLEWTGSNLELDVLKAHEFKVALTEPKIGTHGICILVKDHLKTHSSLVQSPVRGPCRLPIGLVRFYRNKKPIAVFGVHAPPPIRACRDTTEPTLKAVSSWVTDGILRQDIGIAQKGDLAIIVGDMNTLSVQPSIKYFEKSGLRDSFSTINWRPGPTWSPFSWLPRLFRLDYIFVSSKIKISDSEIFNLPGSDHRGIFADIEIIG